MNSEQGIMNDEVAHTCQVFFVGGRKKLYSLSFLTNSSTDIL